MDVGALETYTNFYIKIFQNLGLNFRFMISGADSLSYLSVDGLRRAVQFQMKVTNPAQSGHCTACLTGEYPGGIPEELSW